MTLYDVLGARHDGGWHRHLSVDEVLAHAPGCAGRASAAGCCSTTGWRTTPGTRSPSPGPHRRTGRRSSRRGPAADGLLEDGGRVVGARVHDTLGGDDLEVRARVVIDATGVWGADPASPLLGRDPPAPVARRPPRRAARPDPERCRADDPRPRQGRVPRSVAALLADRHDGRAVRRADRPADGRARRGRRAARGGEPGARRRPDAGRRRRHVRRAAAADRPVRRRRLDDPGVARAPGRRRGERPRPGQRRQVHDVPGDGGADGRRRPRRARRGGRRRRPSGTATRRLVGRGRPTGARGAGGRAAAESRAGRPPWSDRLVARHGTAGARRARARSRVRAARPPRRRRGPPRGRGRLGRPPRARPRRSTTSSPAGCGSSRSCRTVAPSVAPRVAAILGGELGWDEARQAAEVAVVPRRRPPRVRGRA